VRQQETGYHRGDAKDAEGTIFSLAVERTAKEKYCPPERMLFLFFGHSAKNKNTIGFALSAPLR
jgi:hypothetical protein